MTEGLKGAAIGKAMVALDGDRQPRAVLKTIELEQRRFEDVGDQFAYDEGEGDRSLAYWRDAHKRYFTRLGLFQPDMMLGVSGSVSNTSLSVRDVQPLQHHHQPSRDHQPVSRRQPLRRQPRADAQRVSHRSGGTRTPEAILLIR